MKVAVVGSEMAGLTAARILEAAGAMVTVFDINKGNRVLLGGLRGKAQGDADA